MQSEIEQNRLRGRSKRPRVFKPALAAQARSMSGREISNPEGVFIDIVGVDDVKALRNVGELIKKGVSSASLLRIKNTLAISKDELLTYLDISKATYARRTKDHGKLNPVETDRIYRYSRLFALAKNMFHGDRDEALRWLKSPAYAFKGETPLEHARTEFGAHEVETLIGRIEHGIPS